MSSTTDEFYLTSRHGNCGGTTMFYNKNGKGYGTNLNNAELFTLEKAQQYHDLDREALPLLKPLVDKAASLHVDCQVIDGKDVKGQSFPDEWVVQKNGHWSGNDILFASTDGFSYDYRKAKVFSLHEAVEFGHGENGDFTFWPRSYLDTKARRALAVSDINVSKMIKKAGVKYHPPKRVRPTTGKTRSNCPECGKITWGYDPHVEHYCPDHESLGQAYMRAYP